VAASCGDGVVRAGVEACDDGNGSDTDACLTTCATATCGDGFVRAGVEACDDGNGVNTDACLATCVAATCGDGFVRAGVEACDDGNTVNTDACSNICKSGLGAPCASDAQCSSGDCSLNCVGGATPCLIGACVPTVDLNADGDANDAVDFRFEYVPAGTYTMGAPTTEVGRLANEILHSVTISRALFVAAGETTVRQWKVASSGVNPSLTSPCTLGDDCPVEMVEWFTAISYANWLSAREGLPSCYTLPSCSSTVAEWSDGITLCSATTTDYSFAGTSCLGYRLPTESEWEYAYRAGTTTALYNGDLANATTDANAGLIAWYQSNSSAQPRISSRITPTKAPNVWGLYDIGGNVWEWTFDVFTGYPAGPLTDPLGGTFASGTTRALRGGGWNSAADKVRAAYRNNASPAFRRNDIGFRLVRTSPR
jgi:cysteine-rich repeat protein